MKYCPFCGSGLKDNMMFCPKCGKAFEDATANPNMVDTDIGESVDIIEQNDNRQKGENTVEGHTENIEPKYEETIKDESVKEPHNNKKKRKLWIFVLTTCVLCVAIVSLLYAMQQKGSIADSSGNVSTTNNLVENVENAPTINSAKEAVDSVLYLELYDDKEELVGTASGFIIEDGNTLVTNYHVIEDAYSIVAWSSYYEKAYKVETLLTYDEKEDLAILKCDTNGEVLPLILGDSNTVLQGDKVYAIGYPLGVANTLSDGIVSSRYVEDEVDYLQITAAISRGSSGGAVLNEAGEVVGVACASYTDGQNLNLAISSADLKELISKGYTEQLLLNYYNSLNRYGSTPINLIGGNIIAENDKYTYYVNNGLIRRYNHDTMYLDVGEIFGKFVNAYKDSVYYYNELSNDIYVCDMKLMNRVPLGILSDKRIEATRLANDYYIYEETINQMLVAKERLFLNFSLYSNETLWSNYLVVLDLKSTQTILYSSPEICGDFTYYNDNIYVGLAGGGILKLSMLNLDETLIDTSCEPYFRTISDDGRILYIDNESEINSIFIFNTTNEQINEIHLKGKNFSVVYNSNISLPISFFSYENRFYVNAYNGKQKNNNDIYLINFDGTSNFIKGLDVDGATYGISEYYFKDCIHLDYGRIKFNLLTLQIDKKL